MHLLVGSNAAPSETQGFCSSLSGTCRPTFCLCMHSEIWGRNIPRLCMGPDGVQREWSKTRSRQYRPRLLAAHWAPSCVPGGLLRRDLLRFGIPARNIAIHMSLNMWLPARRGESDSMYTRARYCLDRIIDQARITPRGVPAARRLRQPRAAGSGWASASARSRWPRLHARACSQPLRRPELHLAQLASVLKCEVVVGRGMATCRGMVPCIG